MNTTLCATCEEPVVQAQNGRVLQPRAHRVGIFDPQDGEPLTQRDIAQRIRDTGLAGHPVHRCPLGQAALFDKALDNYIDKEAG